MCGLEGLEGGFPGDVRVSVFSQAGDRQITGVSDDPMRGTNGCGAELPVSDNGFDRLYQVKNSAVLECERKRVHLKWSWNPRSQDSSGPEDFRKSPDGGPGLRKIEQDPVERFGAQQGGQVILGDVPYEQTMGREEFRDQFVQIVHGDNGVFFPFFDRGDVTSGRGHPQERHCHGSGSDSGFENAKARTDISPHEDHPLVLGVNDLCPSFEVRERLPDRRSKDRVLFPFFYRNGSAFPPFPDQQVMRDSQAVDIGGPVVFEGGDVMAPATGIIKDEGFAGKKGHDRGLYGGIRLDSRACDLVSDNVLGTIGTRGLPVVL